MPIVIPPATPIVIPPESVGLQPEEGLYALLAGDVSVASLAGARIYPNKLPQPLEGDDDGFLQPSIVYMRIGGPIDYAHDGPIDLKMVRFWIDIYATTHRAVRQLRDAVEAVISGYSGTPDDQDVEFQGIFIEQMREFFEPEPEYKQYRSNIEFVIHFLVP